MLNVFIEILNLKPVFVFFFAVLLQLCHLVPLSALIVLFATSGSCLHQQSAKNHLYTAIASMEQYSLTINFVLENHWNFELQSKESPELLGHF